MPSAGGSHMTIQDENAPVLNRMTVFADLGEHYINASKHGTITDFDAVSTASGTHVSLCKAGYLQTFFQQNESETGTQSVTSNLVSGTCCILQDTAGKITILGSSGMDSYMIRQEDSTLSEPEQFEICSPQGAAFLDRYLSQKTENGYKVAVLYAAKDRSEYQVGYFEWEEGTVKNAHYTGISTDSSQVYWMKDEDDRDVLFLSIEGENYQIDPAETDRMSGRRKLLSLQSEKERIAFAFEQECIAVTDAGQVFSRSADGQELNWSVKTNCPSLSEIRALSACGHRHYFLFSRERKLLYHCCASADGTEMNFIPLEDDVLEFKTIRSERTAELILLKGKQESPQVIRYALSEDGQEWHSEEIYTSAASDFRKINAHIIDCTLYDQNNGIIRNGDFLLWAADSVAVRVSDTLLRLGRNQKFRVHSDENGTLEIIMETDSIDGIELILQQYDTAHPEGFGNYFVISPGEKYKNKFATMDPAELSNARTANGNAVVPKDLEGREEAIQQACISSKDVLSGSEMKDNAALQDIRIDEKDEEETLRKVSKYREDPTDLLRLHAPQCCRCSFEMQFTESGIRYQRLTSSAALQRMREIHMETHPSGNAIFLPDAANGFFSSIASFFKAIGKGLVKVVSVVVAKVEEAVHSAISFLVNGIRQVVKFVVSKAREALRLISTIFEKINVGIENIIAWIGFIFDWKDIRNSADWIRIKMEEALEYTENYVRNGKEKVVGKIEEMQKHADQLLEWLQNAVLPSQNLLDNSTQAPKDDVYHQADAHNIVKKKYFSQISYSTGENVLALSSSETDIFQRFIEIAESCAMEISEDFINCFNEIIHGTFSVQKLAKYILAFLQDIIDALFAAVRTGTEALFDATADLIGLIRSYAGKAIHIPLVSALIHFCTGTDLTLMNLFSFMIAVPATLTYKILYQKAPVSPQKNEDTSAFLRTVLAFTGFLYGAAKASADFLAISSKKQTLLGISKTVWYLLAMSMLLILMCCQNTVKSLAPAGPYVILIGLIQIAVSMAGFFSTNCKRNFSSFKVIIAVIAFIAEIYMLTQYKSTEAILLFPGGVVDTVANIMAALSVDQRGQMRLILEIIVCVLDGIVGISTSAILLAEKNTVPSPEYAAA